MNICSNAIHFWFLFWHWNLILIQSEFHLSAAVTGRCTRNRGNLPPKCAITRKTVSREFPHATNEERCLGEIELDSLQKKNEGMGNNSGTEYKMKIYKVFKTC